MTVQLKGFEGLVRSLSGLTGQTSVGAKAGLVQLANNIMTEAKQRVPVDQGVLRSSGYVDADGLTVQVGFGGAAAAYAVRQHEDLSLIHPGGGQAKYLESAIDDARPTAEKVVAEFIRRVTGL